MQNGDKPISPTGHYQSGIGLTKREYFAGLAMQGILSNPKEGEVTASSVLESIGLDKSTQYSFDEHYPKYIAKTALMYADELLKQLEQ